MLYSREEKEKGILIASRKNEKWNKNRLGSKMQDFHIQMT